MRKHHLTKQYNECNTPAHFDSQLAEGKIWFSPTEAAEMLGVSSQYIRNHLRNNSLLGHIIETGLKTDHSNRKTYRVHRGNLLLFMIRTANYNPLNFMKHVQELLCLCPTCHLQYIKEFIEKKLEASASK